MRIFYRVLALLIGLALGSSAQAGPNAGGVVIAHVNEGLTYTADNTGYCGQSSIEWCSSADTRVDGAGLFVFYAIAAFPSSPRLAGITFGVDYDAEQIVLVEWGSCGDFTLPTNQWPAPGSGVAVTWDVGQTDRAIEVYWFAGYSDTGDPSEFRITEHPSRGLEPYFADDDVPSNLDVALDTGSLGFNTDGYLPCASNRSCALSLRPSRVTAYRPCGGTFPVDLMVHDVEDMGAFSVCVGYDDSQLGFATAAIDPAFLGSTGRSVIPGTPLACNPFCQQSGMRLAASTTGAPDGPSGSGRLGQLFFSIPASADGEDTICLYDWSLGDTDVPPEMIYVDSAPGVEVSYSPYCYGDYNGDGDVTVLDLAQIFPRWPKCVGAPGYDARFDVNLLEEGNYCASTPDGCVDVVDVQSVAGRWHQGCENDFARAEPVAPDPSRRQTLPSIRISPASPVLLEELGDTTSVSLVIDDASDLGAFEAELTFDPAVLQLYDVDRGDLLGSTGRTTYALTPQIDNTAGVVRFGFCTVGTTPGASGSGELAEIVFEVVDCSATTNIAISFATVTNTGGWPQQLGGTAGGSIEIHCSPTSAPSPVARELRLSIRPNPLLLATEITFQVPAQSGGAVATQLDVFDASGRLVRSLLKETLSPGLHSVGWDARDGAGNTLPASAYFCRLRVGDRTEERRMVLTR